MPGGIGLVDRKTALACWRASPGAPICAEHSEAEIFYRLAAGRVCYCPAREALYFTDSPHLQVAELLQLAFRGLGRNPGIEQLHLDLHGLFRGAHRVAIGSRDADAVLIALRLAGVQVEISR